MKSIFKKQEIFRVKSKPYEPSLIADPTTADEYQRRGMAYYARKQFTEAVVELQKAISLDENHIDSYYSLGMVYKAMNKKDQAVEAFNHAIELITSDSNTRTTKFDMLRRLARGHINEINLGDWDLEKEIWKRKN